MPFDLRAGCVGVATCVTFEVPALNPPTARRGCFSGLEKPLIHEFAIKGLDAEVRHAAILPILRISCQASVAPGELYGLRRQNG